MGAPPKAFYVAAMPLTLLGLMIAGLHYLPQTTDEDTTTTAPPKRVVTKRTGPRPTPMARPVSQPVDPSTQKALETQVAGQIAAFRRHDFDGALRFAVPEFRDHWTPERFETLIRSSYRSLMDSRSQTFTQAQRYNDSAMVTALVIDRDRTRHTFNYSLTQRDGAWYVANCGEALPAPPGAIAP